MYLGHADTIIGQLRLVHVFTAFVSTSNVTAYFPPAVAIVDTLNLSLIHTKR